MPSLLGRLAKIQCTVLCQGLLKEPLYLGTNLNLPTLWHSVASNRNHRFKPELTSKEGKWFFLRGRKKPQKNTKQNKKPPQFQSSPHLGSNDFAYTKVILRAQFERKEIWKWIKERWMGGKEWKRKLRIIVRTSSYKRCNVLSEYQESISGCPKKPANNRNDKYAISPLTVTGSKMMQFFMSWSQNFKVLLYMTGLNSWFL